MLPGTALHTVSTGTCHQALKPGGQQPCNQWLTARPACSQNRTTKERYDYIGEHTSAWHALTLTLMPTLPTQWIKRTAQVKNSSQHPCTNCGKSGGIQWNRHRGGGVWGGDLTLPSWPPSLAEPQPKLNLMYFSHKIWLVVTFFKGKWWQEMLTERFKLHS